MIYKNGKLKRLIKDGKNVKSVYKGHIKIWPSSDKLLKFVKDDGTWEAGDIVLFSKKSNKKFAINPNDIDRFDVNLFSPIGIVVIPQSHNVYGNGCAGVVSLKYMDYSNPDNGSSAVKSMYYGYYTETVESLLNYFTPLQSLESNRCRFYHYGACTTTPKTTTSGNTYRYIYFPSNKFTKQQYPNDDRLKYNYDVDSSSTYYWGISPYKNDDTKNADFNQYCGQYFNGKQYQNIWLSLITTSNWKTSSTISNTYSEQGHYPPFMCAWRYNPEGTNQGDWFIPSYPEFIYMLPKFNEIYNSFTKVYNYFWNSNPPSLNYSFMCSNYPYYNTGEWKNCQMTISLSSGLYTGGYKYSNTNYALAFTQLKSDNFRDKVNFTFKVNINEGIDFIYLNINGLSYSVKKTTTFTVAEFSRITWTIILKNGYELNNIYGLMYIEENYVLDVYPTLIGIPIHLLWEGVSKYLINGIQPISGDEAFIIWNTLKGIWNKSEFNEAFDNDLYTCLSPGTNGMTTLKCAFKGIKSITFTYRSNAESTYDYLVISKLDNDLSGITSWNSSGTYTNIAVQDYTRGSQTIWKSYTYQITDNNEHFVEFMFGKDSSQDVSPDNAEVYISNIVYNTPKKLDTIYYPKDTEITWSAEPENGYELEIPSGNFILTTETTINPYPKIKQIPLHLIFNENIDEIIVNNVSYYENTTLNFNYGVTIHYEALSYNEDYDVENGTGEFVLLTESTISPTAANLSLITNEIRYITSDNKPISLSTTITNNFGGTFVSNKYDEEYGCCRIIVNGNITKINGTSASSSYAMFYAASTLVKITLLPSTITTINGYLCYSCSNLESVNLRTLKNLTSIGDYVFYNCPKLTNLDFSKLNSLKTIGNYFCYNSYIDEINIDSGLNNLTAIGDNAFSSCKNLQKVNISNLTKLTSIGNYFCSSVSNITDLKLNNLPILNSIGTNFCDTCNNLKTLTLSKLTILTKINDYFCNSCSSLISLTLSDLNITQIGNYFCTSCTNLSSINLSNFNSLTSIGNSFCSGCSSLNNNVQLNNLSKLTSIGNYFLSSCKLTSINLSGLSNLQSIGNYFLYNNSFTTINLSPLINLTSIGSYFLSTNNFTSIDLTVLPKIETIGSYLLSNNKFTSFELCNIPSLKSFESNILYGNSTLKSIKIHDLENLEYIPSYIVNQNVNIESVEMYNLPNVKSIKTYMIYFIVSDSQGTGSVKYLSIKLKTITIGDLPNLETIGANFLHIQRSYKYGGTDSYSLTSITLGDMPKLTSIGTQFIYLHSAYNDCINRLSIQTLSFGNMDSLTSLPTYFIYPYITINNSYTSSTITITNFKFGSAKKLSTINNNFIYSGTNQSTGISTITLPNSTVISAINNLSTRLSSVGTIYVYAESADIWKSLLSTLTSKIKTL